MLMYLLVHEMTDRNLGIEEKSVRYKINPLHLLSY